MELKKAKVIKVFVMDEIGDVKVGDIITVKEERDNNIWYEDINKKIIHHIGQLEFISK